MTANIIKANLKLINKFTQEITGFEESIEQTRARFSECKDPQKADIFNPATTIKVEGMFICLVDVFDYFIYNPKPTFFKEWYKSGKDARYKDFYKNKQ